MGINHLPEIRDYWSTDPLLHYSPIADRIARDRFEEISRYLHFADNNVLPKRGESGYTRTQKVDPILTAMKTNCSKLLKPHRQLSVDEAMIPFKGRSSLKQYMPKKPVKRGFKVWVIAEACSGYFLDFNIYTGATGDTEHGLSTSVVTSLAQQYQHEKRQVFCDNYFTSVDLFHQLSRNETYACGTARPDRKGYPSELLENAKSMERGEHRFRQYGSLVATVWKDTKHVKMLSTMNHPDSTTTVNRKLHDGSTVDVSCPQCIDDYNHYMSGVDKGDQLRGYYHVRLKCRKNYKYIFWFLFDVAITNAFILMQRYSASTTKPLTMKEFRMHLAKGLIDDYMSRKRAGRPRSNPQPPTTPVTLSEHFPAKTVSSRCELCKKVTTEGRPRDSTWQCPACPNKPNLCFTGKNDGTNCFVQWHNRR